MKAVKFNNGVFTFETNEQTNKFRYKPPNLSFDFDYDETANCPTWDKFLGEVMVDELARDVFRNWLGSLLTGECNEQCVIFYGIGLGKSTIAELLKVMFGATTESIENMTGRDGLRSMARIALTKSPLNIADGENLADLSCGRIKSIISCTPQQAREMYKEAFLIEDMPKHIFIANEIPQDWDWTQARRVTPIEFSYTPEQIDYKLIDKLKAEMSGIFNWIMDGITTKK